MFASRTRVALAAVLVTLLLAENARAADMLPARLSDEAYWSLIDQISEIDGKYPSDSFVSNELGFQNPIPELRPKAKPGGVYLGVGPEQNFTYIAAFQPRIAFIIDVRRQNLVNHLFYKALFELASNRADFLSRLFCIERPEGLTDASTLDELFAAYSKAARTNEAFVRNRDAVQELLQKKHGFALTDQDLAGLDRVYRAFSNFGQDITYDSGTTNSNRIPAPKNSRESPSYAAMGRATDLQGTNHNFLANEDNYRIVRDMEMRNLIVPVVGDFGGPKAIRAVGAYLKEHQATVTVFYTSNVERYLLQQPTAETPNGGWRKFIASVATLPLDSSSMFIRVSKGSYANQPIPSVFQPIQETLQAVKEGRIKKRTDLFAPSK